MNGSIVIPSSRKPIELGDGISGILPASDERVDHHGVAGDLLRGRDRGRANRVLVHAICVTANHYHAVVTDPDETVSEVYHYVHELTAKTLNTSRCRWESMWACA